jgi:hypothetical protein
MTSRTCLVAILLLAAQVDPVAAAQADPGASLVAILRAPAAEETGHAALDLAAIPGLSGVSGTAPSAEPRPPLALREPFPAPDPGPSWLAAVAPAERDLGLFLAAQASLFVDMAQTLEIARRDDLLESNRLLGEQPSDGEVLAYFGGLAALHAASYLALPERWANVLSRAVLIIQLPAIDHNARLGVAVRF